MPIYTPGKVLLRKTWQPMDADAAAYITAVETADGQALEEKTKIAIDNFVLGCKADGIWGAIKASCILAGARTLSGALVPLVGTAPTRFGADNLWDYNRKTGLIRNSGTSYLDSNRANNADPQNSNHNACWVSVPGDNGLMGSNENATGQNFADISTSINRTRFSSRSSSQGTTLTAAHQTGLYGHVRTASNLGSYRTPMASGAADYASQVPDTRNVLIFATNTATAATRFGFSRLAFYSIGESLNLALLDARVTDLINAFAAAIP